MTCYPYFMSQVSEPQEAIATVTSKGQVTIPASIRRLLGLQDHDRLIFMVSPAGEITIRPLKFPTLATLAGVAGTLRKPAPDDLVAAAYEERLERKYGRK